MIERQAPIRYSAPDGFGEEMRAVTRDLQRKVDKGKLSVVQAVDIYTEMYVRGAKNRIRYPGLYS
jgi:hypothetical protein